MNFDYSEDQTAIRDLAEKVFKATAGGFMEQETASANSQAKKFDADLWSNLGNSGLLGAAVSERHGGYGFGLEELCLVMERYGAGVTHVPVLQTALVSMFIDCFGEQEHVALLADAISGRSHFTFAVERENTLRIEKSGSGEQRISGVLSSIPFAMGASAMLLAAVDDSGQPTWVLLPADHPGVNILEQECTNLEPVYQVTVDAALTSEMVIDSSGDSLSWLEQRALTLIAAVQLGVLEEALARTAAYISERKQFGKPVGSFQAVAHRAADAYIDTQALRSVTWQAAYLIDRGRDASRESRVAKWWAAKAGHDVSHSVQHLHGGIGADLDYPIHRYFLWSKRMELYLGGRSYQLDRMGRELVTEMQGVGA